MLWIAADCNRRDTGPGRRRFVLMFVILDERRVQRGILWFSKDKTRPRGTCPTVNDSLSAGTVNEQLPTGGAAGVAAGCCIDAHVVP
jgi:hypothetical protein